MADPKRLKRAARSGWLAACCTVGISLLLAARAFAVVTITVQTSDGVQGGNLTLTMSLSRADTDPVIANADIDVIFDTTQMQLVGSCSNGGAECQSSAECGQGTCVLPCQLDARLTQQSFTANSPGFPPVPMNHRRLRLAVFDDIQHPAASFDSGALITCTFEVLANAQPDQSVSLSTDRLNVGDNSFNSVPDAQVQVMPGTIKPAPTPTLTPTPTRTPTPPFPCFADQDCPLGQICDPTTKVCTPATPTPTIACTDGNCPNGLICVDGVCRAPTPTPLPPCSTDADCLMPGTQCRAGVCVPIRQCSDTDPVLDRNNCRGSRETCTNGKCECGGDCDLDGFVFGNEITRMICIMSGSAQCEFSDCLAGDFDADGKILGTEVCMAVKNLTLGCPAEGQPLVFPQDVTETRSLDIGSATGLPGSTVTIDINLGAGQQPVATAQLDLLFDTNVLEIPDPTTACQIEQSQTADTSSFTELPQTPQTPPGMARLRLFVGDINLCKEPSVDPSIGTLNQGRLLSCQFTINPLAHAGASPLTGVRLNIGDPVGNEFTAVSTPGQVVVLALTPTETPSETPTITGTPPTATSTPTITGTPATQTPTETPTITPGTPSVTPSNTATRTPTIPVGSATPTSTATSTPTVSLPTATATPTSTPKSAAAGGGGGGCNCNVDPAAANAGSGLAWAAIPLALLRRRRRR